jgi:sn-glycerol 3-phosphate transport system ATP-binding protein
MATISLRDVRKSYAKTEVIHGVSIDVADGEFVVIVGPSGCGKSTLLRMVAGLEAISSGQIDIGGRVVNDLEPRERDIAMVFQNYALYPHMTVFDNMAYGLKIANMPKAEIKARVDKAAGMLNLSEFLDRKPRQLSGGQRQRVAMGRALVRDPAAFLFDEPLSNLDAKLRVQMRLQIKEMQRSVGTTSLYVTHDQTEAMTLADRLIVMNKGVAEQIDTPMAIYERPANTFVAGFIGSPAMNILPATLGEGCVILAAGQQLVAQVPRDGLGKDVFVGLRPEHLNPVEADGPGVMALQVRAVETLGADAYAHTSLSGHPGTEVVVRVPGAHPPAVGAVMYVRPAPDSLHLFDAASTARITNRDTSSA